MAQINFLTRPRSYPANVEKNNELLPGYINLARTLEKILGLKPRNDLNDRNILEYLKCLFGIINPEYEYVLEGTPVIEKDALGEEDLFGDLTVTIYKKNDSGNQTSSSSSSAIDPLFEFSIRQAPNHGTITFVKKNDFKNIINNADLTPEGKEWFGYFLHPYKGQNLYHEMFSSYSARKSNGFLLSALNRRQEYVGKQFVDNALLRIISNGADAVNKADKRTIERTAKALYDTSLIAADYDENDYKNVLLPVLNGVDPDNVKSNVTYEWRNAAPEGIGCLLLREYKKNIENRNPVRVDIRTQPSKWLASAKLFHSLGFVVFSCEDPIDKNVVLTELPVLYNLRVESNIESLDCSKLNALRRVKVESNKIKSVILAPTVGDFVICSNKIESLNFFQQNADALDAPAEAPLATEKTPLICYSGGNLKDLRITSDSLNTLNNIPNSLQSLLVESNSLESLDFSKNNLTQLDITSHSLKNLILPPTIEKVDVKSNSLESLDCSQNTNLKELTIESNSLKNLILPPDIEIITITGSLPIGMSFTEYEKLSELTLSNLETNTLVVPSSLKKLELFTVKITEGIDFSNCDGFNHLYLANEAEITGDLDLSRYENVNIDLGSSITINGTLIMPSLPDLLYSNPGPRIGRVDISHCIDKIGVKERLIDLGIDANKIIGG
jgi:hypothetical protein